MDEIQTGCGSTGRFWAHEHFRLPEAPDIVAFGKKMLTGGFYYREEMRPQEVGAECCLLGWRIRLNVKLVYIWCRPRIIFASQVYDLYTFMREIISKSKVWLTKMDKHPKFGKGEIRNFSHTHTHTPTHTQLLSLNQSFACLFVCSHSEFLTPGLVILLRSFCSEPY